MKHQLRHREMGLFQGVFLGLAFWHPMSEMPEQGICELDEQDARDLIDSHCDPSREHPFKREDFIIEPFDKSLNDELVLKNALR